MCSLVYGPDRFKQAIEIARKEQAFADRLIAAVKRAADTEANRRLYSQLMREHTEVTLDIFSMETALTRAEKYLNTAASPHPGVVTTPG